MSDYAGNSAKLAIESIRNSRLRDHYIQIVKQTSDDILKEAEHAETLSPCQQWDIWKGAAMKASKLRNDHMEKARQCMSPSALAFSKLIKTKAPTFPEIWKRYKERLYVLGEDGLPYLSTDKQHSIFKAIIKASGRTNTVINIVSKVLACCWSMILMLTFGFILFSVYRSDSPTVYVIKCAVTIGTGALGACAGSTSAFYIARYFEFGNLTVLILSISGGMALGFASAVLSDVIVSIFCDKTYNLKDSFVSFYP